MASKDNYEIIHVTKPSLPPIDEYIKYLEGIWDRNYVTNNGPLVQKLELELRNFFGVKHCLLVGNGTLAIQLAIKALELEGEIITTPFSFVATTSSIVWENCTPVFVDIDKDSLNIDPYLIENAITEKTTAILATHVYGNPCEVDTIQKIANKYNLKLIYDAAHAFGVKYNNSSILSYGDISTISFHATKLFSTVEGGAVVTNNDKLADKINKLRNFGIVSGEIVDIGINAKNSEFHAAYGLCMLPRVNTSIEKRREICRLYDQLLKGFNSNKPNLTEGTDYNYAYYPVCFKNEEHLLKVLKKLNENKIYPRRYFYPSLNQLHYVNNTPMPIAEDIAKRVLCLPLYSDLKENDILRIVNNIKDVLI